MNKNIKYYGVIGNPILHSLSPNIFNSMFEKENLNHRYIRIAATNGKDAMDIFKDLGLSGINVTAPFKEDIIYYLDRLKNSAKKINSVNTIIREENKIVGDNTDYLGVVNSIKKAGIPNLYGKTCLVIGCGGAGKAAIYGLLNEGAIVIIANRTISKAKTLTNKYNKYNCQAINFEDINKELLSKCSVVVYSLANSINYKNIINPDNLHKNLTILDANYHRMQDSLLNVALDKGCNTIDGKEWLLNQALPVYKMFTGNDANEKFLRKILYNTINNNNKRIPNNVISLIGFMGTGKSSIGEILATKLNYDFIDSDEYIETNQGKTISKIFEEDGEEKFREYEKQFLSKIKQFKNTVISFGGGIINNKENRDIIKNNSLCLWIYAPLNIIIERTKDNNSRPLLNNNNEKNIENLYNSRKYYYAQTSDILINNSLNIDNNIIKQGERIYEEISKTFGV